MLHAGYQETWPVGRLLSLNTKMHTHIRHDLDLLEAKTRAAKLETTLFPYPKDALEPVISEACLNYNIQVQTRKTTP